MHERNVSDTGYWKRQEKIYKRSFISIGLLIINVLIFLLSSTVMNWMYEKGAMITELVLNNFEYYRLFSAIFLHANSEHLLNNMFMLLLVGAIVENYTGHAYFLFMFLFSGFFGNLVSMVYEIRNNLDWISVGASGGIMGLVGFVVLWVIVNRKSFINSRYMLIRMVLLGIFVIQSCFFQEGANTMAHLGGFIAGVILGIVNIIMLKNNKIMEGLG